MISLNHSSDDTFEKVYSNYITPIYRYVYIRVKHKEEAEDLTHTIFIKAFEAKKKRQAEITLNYLFTIARRTVIDFWRKKKELNPADPERIFENIVDSSQNVQQMAEREDDKNMVEKFMAKLDGDQKDVVIMKFLNDLTTKEIANIMKKSEEAIRKIQSRALKNIRMINH